MDSFTKHWFTSILIFFLILPIFSQSESDEVFIDRKFYNSNNYVRSPLFKEQDLIYGRTVNYAQGLELICHQDKVKVEISGYDALYTPVDLNNIPAGEYKVTLSKTGYYPSEIRITISSDERTSIFVNLIQYTSILTLNGLPENSIVYLNNHQIESTTLEVPRGENSLRISAFGYEDYTKILDISGQEEISFSPQLIKRNFKLNDLEISRTSIWLNDSRSQQKSTISIFADAPGKGVLTIINLTDNQKVIEEEIIFDKARKDFIFDINQLELDDANIYKIIVRANDEENFVEVSSSIEVKEGTKSIWRNNLSGFSGFLFAPSAETLPAGTAQIQTAISPVFDTNVLTDSYYPTTVSIRAAFIDKLEIGLGASLFISPNVNETSLNIFASGKYSFLGNDGSDGFSLATGLSVNYNGKISDYSLIPPYDPFGGLTGVSIIVPLQYRLGKVLFAISPEIKLSPTFPGISDGGFASGIVYIWNYFRAAVSIDLGEISTALSVALQSPSYLNSTSQNWPLFTGLELSSTPGASGFSFSLMGGIRYSEGEAIQITSGLSAGFIF